MRIPVFARRSNPAVDRPIIRKSLSYAETQIADRLADWVDVNDKRQGIVAREYLAAHRCRRIAGCTSRTV